MNEVPLSEILAWRFHAAPRLAQPPQVLAHPQGGISLVASRMPNLDGYRRAVVLIADLEVIGLRNLGVSASNAMEQIIGHCAPLLINEYDIPPERIHWIQVDTMGLFDVVRPEFPTGPWRYTWVNAVWTPLRAVLGAPRSAVAFRSSFPEVGEALLCRVLEMAGRPGAAGTWPGASGGLRC